MKDDIDYNKIGTLTAEEAIEALKVYEKTACDRTQMKGANACRMGIRAIESQVRWIPCSERMPPERESIFAKFKGTDKWSNSMFESMSDDVNVTVEYENGERRTMTLHTVDGRWSLGQRIKKFKVIAWQPLPEPCRS